MFVYEGRLDWKPYGDNETFVIVLPDGPVRVGDTVYLFYQWTFNASNVKKDNSFHKIAIDKVSKTPGGDDTFIAKSSYYSWEITSGNVYQKLKVVMRNPSGYESPMEFKRIWQSEGDVTAASTRIWTGKITWDQYANNEMAIFIAPEGLGQDKPILSMWQWTRDGNGVAKAPSFRAEPQKVISNDDNGVKFNYKSYYDIDCSWNRKTEKLSVKVKGPGSPQDLGDFGLAALIDRHSHDWDPPQTPGKKAELELHSPQPQPSLARVADPLPFPKTLIETLRHTIAYADQAGYLAQYAHDRFTALDADFHARGHQLDTAKAQGDELSKEVKKLTGDLSVEKAKADDLTKRLEEARQANEAEAKRLQDEIAKSKQHDSDDHKAIELLESQLQYERASKAEVQKKLDQASTALAAAEARNKADSERIAGLVTRIAIVEAQLEVETKDNKRLSDEKKQQAGKITDLEKQLKDLKAQLEKALKDLKEQQDLVAQKTATITQRDQDIIELKKAVEAGKIALAALQKQLDSHNNEIRKRLRCNLKSEITDDKDVMFDLNGGGGKNPAVHAWSDGDYYTMNSNAMWDIYSVGDSNNIVVIKSPSKGYVLYSKGHGKNVCCEAGKNVADPDAQWEIQGATIDNMDHKVIQFRNVKDKTSLDLCGGDTKNGTAFLTYNPHGGKNQKFRVYKV
ncbi:uncharacterized protein B0J16DRAFT_348272 [Fusarium flagelliforme]|uniref:uncharacterized protein n=1 Tax=Fusarium flagelliforme TaxID=2675880 RepID=UPI001E8CC9DD|nr:uncharacterized protein B0J16DRAFT_348272 [Fusarium flagelliforme]KAH7174192.1 hypothetical protein B0J16DRAFT_348272 [Fusarium flagelliforme]